MLKGLPFHTFALLSIIHVSLAAICLNKPRCYCNKNKTEISCKNVSDLTPVETYTSKLPGLYSVRIYGFEPTSISTPIFNGQSMTVLDISGALSSISDDALSGIKGLKIVNFQGTSLPSVPKAFSSPSLTTVQMTHGALGGIDDTLQNNTQATDFLFNNNRISSVSKSAFLNAIYLMYLNLSCNQLSFLDPSVFHGFRQLKSVDLSHNKLLTVDGFLTYLNPQDVNLYGNSLSSVDNAFHPNMNDLKWLSLGGNPNLKLNSSIFQDMPNLLKLDISDNHYNSLDSGILKNLNKLYTLVLSGNNFSSIPPSILQYGSRISTLDLSDNSLSSADNLFPLNDTSYQIHTLKTVKLSGNSLHSMVFGVSSKSVQHLDLSRNTITSIEATDLENLTSLTSLNFSSNPLSQVDASSFRNQKSMDVLDLSHTDIVTLNHSIQNLIELEKLIIDSSSLESLDEVEFQGSTSLKFISLRYNKLSSVKGMKGLTNLTMLDVSHNNLTTLTEDTFPAQKKLKKLWMEGNFWTCDCKISWLLDRIKAKGTSLEDNPLCHAPPSLKGIPISKLNHTDLTIVHQDCPEPCNCTCIPNGHDAIVSVNCANRSLDKAPDRFPSKTKVVYLNNNNLEEFVLNTKEAKLNRAAVEELMLKAVDENVNRTSLEELLLKATEGKLNRTSVEEFLLMIADGKLNRTNKELLLKTADGKLNRTILDDPLLKAADGKSDRTSLEELLLKVVDEKLNITSVEELLLKAAEVKVNRTSLQEMLNVKENNLNSVEEFILNAQEPYQSNFEVFESLDVLDMEENRLRRVELKGVPRVLKLARNNLSRLDVKGWNIEGVKEITLGENPWICDCGAWSFIEWLLAHKGLVKDIQSLRCDNKGEITNRFLIELVRDDVCKGYFSTEDVILLAAVGLFFLVLCLCVFFFRHTLGAIFYSCGCSCLKMREKKSFSFDAFLLFEDADEDFALHTIAEGLENTPQAFKLFVPNREVFLTTESVNVASTVNDCCKIIVILSRGFVENPQCMQLLKSCISSALTSSGRLIFITRSGLGLDLVSDPVLGNVIRKNSILKWGHCLFWQKLRYCMPRKDTRRTRWGALLIDEE